MQAENNNDIAITEAKLKDFLSSVLSSEGIVVDIRRTFIEYNGVNRSRVFARHANRMACKGSNEKFVVIALLCYPALQWLLKAQDIDALIEKLKEENEDESVWRMSNIQRILESSMGGCKPQLRLEMRKLFFARCQQLVDEIDEAMNKAVFMNPASKPSRISLAMAMLRGSILDSDPVTAVTIRNNFDSIVEDVTAIAGDAIKPLVMQLAPNEGEAKTAEAAYLYHNTEVLLREYSRIVNPSVADENRSLRILAQGGNTLESDTKKKEDTAEEKKEETPKSEPAAPEEKEDSAPEKAEETPDKEKSETKTEDVPAKDKFKKDKKAEVKEDKKPETNKKDAKPSKKGGSNVILGVSCAVMVAAVGVMGMTMVQNKNADKSSIPAVGGSFSVTGNVAEDTSFTEQAAVAPSTALTSDGRRWAMGASNVLIQAEDGTGAVVPVDAAETFQYDGKSLSFEKDGATYIVRMVADSYTGAAQYAEEQTDESFTVSGMRFAGNGQVLVVVGTRSAGDDEGNAAVRTAVADMLEKAVPAQGSGNITLNGVAVTADGCETSFSNGLALVKNGDGEVKFTPSSYDSETIAFDDAGTTASGAAVTHSDYANVNDTEAYLIESDEGNVMAFTNNADLLTSVLGLQ